VRRISNEKMRLTVRRIIDKFRTAGRCCIRLFTIENKGSFRRRLAKPLHRIFRASPHSRGGASYAVTHSRRKYHHPCMRLVARCCAVSSFAALAVFAPSSRCLSSFHGGFSLRTRRLAPRIQNVSDCPIHFSHRPFPARRDASCRSRRTPAERKCYGIKSSGGSLN
jgi:hypothetical protein